MMAVFGFLAPAAVIYAALTRGRARPSVVSRSLGLALAPGLGIGAASCVYFAALVVAPSRVWAVRLDVVFWTLALALVAWDIGMQRRRQSADAEPLPGRDFTWSSGQVGVIVAGGAFLVTAALAIWSFGIHLAMLPHGERDA